MASEGDAMIPRRLDLSISWHGSRSRQNDTHESRFESFLALAPEVDKIISPEARFEYFLAFSPEVDKVMPGDSSFSILAMFDFRRHVIFATSAMLA